MTGEKLTDLPICPRCNRKTLPAVGADNLFVGSHGKLIPYWCESSSSWHVWNPDVESHQDEYAKE